MALKISLSTAPDVKFNNKLAKDLLRNGRQYDYAILFFYHPIGIL